MDQPRELLPAEERLLRHLLSVDFDGVAQLREQVGETRVVGPWFEGSASLNLQVSDGATRADVPDGPVPVDAWAFAEGERGLGCVLVWVKGGYLHAIEYGWVTDDMPGELPPVESVGVRPDPGPHSGATREDYRFPNPG